MKALPRKRFRASVRNFDWSNIAAAISKEYIRLVKASTQKEDQNAVTARISQ